MECSICLECISNEDAFTTPCNHVFHCDCIKGIVRRPTDIKQHRACPMCRSNFEISKSICNDEDDDEDEDDEIDENRIDRLNDQITLLLLQIKILKLHKYVFRISTAEFHRRYQINQCIKRSQPIN